MVPITTPTLEHMMHDYKLTYPCITYVTCTQARQGELPQGALQHAGSAEQGGTCNSLANIFLLACKAAICYSCPRGWKARAVLVVFAHLHW